VPHLAKLQAKYADKVTVLALSDESVKTVEAFLNKPSRYEGKTWKQAMAFTVATDADGSVKKDIFSAAGQKGIPSSFIIAKGVVQWIGHPSMLDAPLAKVVAGTWDATDAQKQAVKEKAFRRAIERVGPKFAQFRDQPEKLVELFDELLQEFPDRANLKVEKFKILLLALHRDDEAYSLARKIAADHPKNANLHNELAWTIVDHKDVKTRDLNLVLRLAQHATELTKSKNAAILDTLARAHFELGDIDKALSWQEKAVANAQGPMAAELKKALERYRAAKAKPAEPEAKGKKEFF
jgi:hypothetical protein